MLFTVTECHHRPASSLMSPLPCIIPHVTIALHHPSCHHCPASSLMSPLPCIIPLLCRSIPFSKEELTTILKFGAVELFKEGEGEGDHDLQELDIDEILRRAETQATTEESSAANDLLSQFKVASFTLDEEELGGGDPLPTPTEGKTLLLSPTYQVAAPWVEEKSWEEIIPQSYLAKMEEEEKAREQLQLYLPPRRRHVQVGSLLSEATRQN